MREVHAHKLVHHGDGGDPNDPKPSICCAKGAISQCIVHYQYIATVVVVVVVVAAAAAVAAALIVFHINHMDPYHLFTTGIPKWL